MDALDLAGWLEQQIAEDERWANGALREDRGQPPVPVAMTSSIKHRSNWRPDRVLAECAAKRQIIALMALDSYPVDVLQALALPYADRPGYEAQRLGLS